MRLRPLLNTVLLLLAALPLHAAQLPESKPEARVGIVLFDDVQIIDFAGPYEVFGTAGFGVTTVSHDGKPVTTAMGLTVTPDAAFADAPAFEPARLSMTTHPGATAQEFDLEIELQRETAAPSHGG